MRESGFESKNLLEDDIIGVDDEMDLIADGPEEDDGEAPLALDPYSETPAGATAPGIRIDREIEEQEEQ